MRTSSNSSLALSIVIPAYNEERRLPLAIRDLKAFFKSSRSDVEVIIVVEKSQDQTSEVAEREIDRDPMFRLITNNVQRGKGFAVRTGMLEAKGQTVFYMDADLSTPLSEVFSFLATLAAPNGPDIVVGSRADSRSKIIKRQSLFRESLGRTFNFFVQLIGVRGLKDTQCGFKAFRRSTVKPIFSRQTVDGFAFDVEVLLLAEQMNFKIVDLPVRWINSPDSKVRIWIDPLKMLWDLIKIRHLVRASLKAKPYDPRESSDA
jgi:dolichyl-phosphate beta-glucosyltransferase